MHVRYLPSYSLPFLIFFICRYANVSLGASCITENTTYVDEDFNGQPVSITVYRDNCQSACYCDLNSLVCEKTKPLGTFCLSDPECELVSFVMSPRTTV